MSIHAKRAAVVVALFMVFTVVRPLLPLLTSLVSGSGALGAASFSPVEVVGESLIVWVLTYGLSKWWSRRSITAR
jgi:predicted RND superfamily exporter protein